MSVLQKEILQIIHVLPGNSLSSTKPLLNELLTAAVLLKDSSANISEMDEWDKYLFLEAMKRIDDDDYISFEDALAECGINVDELYSKQS